VAPAEEPKGTAIPKAKPGGLQLKSGLKGPGAKKAAPAPETAPEPAAESAPEPTADSEPETTEPVTESAATESETTPEAPKAPAADAPAPPKAKPGGLQIKGGIKPPGRR
ncbi:MAG: Fe-S oxidoreductase, partial [Rhodococcus sp. (in: high G+C Gram-positive bacteria)]